MFESLKGKVPPATTPATSLQTNFNQIQPVDNNIRSFEEVSRKYGINVLDSVETIKFASQHNDQVEGITNKLLPLVKSSDLDQQVRSQLEQVILQAKSVNLEVIGGDRSKVPVIGKLIDRLRLKKEQVAIRHVDSVEDQINKALQQLQTSCNVMADRIVLCQDLMNAYEQEFAAMGEHIGDAKTIKQGLASQVADLEAQLATVDPNDASATMELTMRIQELSDAYNRWDRKVDILLKQQQSAYNGRFMANGTRASYEELINQFITLSEIAIPEWRKQLGLLKMGEEAAKHANMADSMNDFTQDLMIRNATQTKQTMITVAKNAQRGVIDMKTLRKQNELLIEGLTQCATIAVNGAKSRASTEQELITMRETTRAAIVSATAQVRQANQHSMNETVSQHRLFGKK